MIALRLACLLICCHVLGAATVAGWPPADPNTARTETDKRPNVILIMADDMGYGDVSCYGSADMATPHIDALAQRGMRFTSAYMGGPVCGPSRACLLTGRYQNRFGFELNWDNILPTTQPSLAEMLGKTGYHSSIIGKWHLGHTGSTHPNARGFNEFYGRIGGIFNYVPTDKKPEVPMYRGHHELYAQGIGLQYQRSWMQGLQRELINEYTTDRFNKEAVSFIERHKDQVFFLFLSHHAPHSPLQATDRYRQRYPAGHFKKWGERAEQRREYAAMVAAMDDGVGMIHATLKRLQLLDHTIVIFTSDNGGADRWLGSNAPLAGGKGSLWEGGIRVPWIVSWPSQISAGSSSDAAICAFDLWPTLRNLAGGKDHYANKPDGTDLLPVFKGQSLPERVLCWRFGAQRAARKGAWKMLQIKDQPAKLFKVDSDLGEQTNLAAEHPDKLQELLTAYDDWELEMAPPQWGKPKVLDEFWTHYRQRKATR